MLHYMCKKYSSTSRCSAGIMPGAIWPDFPSSRQNGCNNVLLKEGFKLKFHIRCMRCLCSQVVTGRQSSSLTLWQSYSLRLVHGLIHLPHSHSDIWKHHSVFTFFSNCCRILICVPCIWNLSFRSCGIKYQTCGSASVCVWYSGQFQWWELKLHSPMKASTFRNQSKLDLNLDSGELIANGLKFL